MTGSSRTKRPATSRMGGGPVTTEGEVDSVRIDTVNAAGPLAMPVVSVATAVNISAAIRLSYHLYQGVAGVLSVVPMGLLFAIWFARTR